MAQKFHNQLTIYNDSGTAIASGRAKVLIHA